MEEGNTHKVNVEQVVASEPDEAPVVDDFFELVYTVKVKRGKNKNILTEAYTPEGHFIGDLEVVQFLIDRMGIRPEPPKVAGNACIIGFSEKTQKWHGWSHRSNYGFGIGTEYEEGDAGFKKFKKLMDNPQAPRLNNPAKTLEDAKIMAICYAESIQ